MQKFSKVKKAYSTVHLLDFHREPITNEQKILWMIAENMFVTDLIIAYEDKQGIKRFLKIFPLSVGRSKFVDKLV